MLASDLPVAPEKYPISERRPVESALAETTENSYVRYNKANIGAIVHLT